MRDNLGQWENLQKGRTETTIDSYGDFDLLDLG